jgi:hypothetical protein
MMEKDEKMIWKQQVKIFSKWVVSMTTLNYQRLMGYDGTHCPPN